MHVCMHACDLHVCVCTNMHACMSTQALTLSAIIITSSLPPTSHRYFTTSMCPPLLADMRHVLPICKRWPLDHQRARPPAYASRSSRCWSNNTHPRRSPKPPCGVHVNAACMTCLYGTNRPRSSISPCSCICGHACAYMHYVSTEHVIRMWEGQTRTCINAYTHACIHGRQQI
jgi:hypothetical protein